MLIIPSLSLGKCKLNHFVIQEMNYELLLLIRLHRETINSFKYTGLEGKIRLKNPEVEFIVYEDCKLFSSPFAFW